MKHLLIIISILLLSSPVIGISHDGENLYLKDGEKNGQGTLTFSWGGKDEGEYKHGKQDGQGTETYPSGRKYEGEWKNNKPWEGTSYDENGNIMGKWVNGKWIKQ